MKILLLFPRWTSQYGVFAHFARRSSVIPPINLAYLAAIAENRGHEVRILDCEAEGLSDEMVLEETGVFGPDVVGLTASTATFHLAASLAAKIKERFPEICTAIGGPHVTVLKERGLEPGFDVGFVGEADESWAQFLDQFGSGRGVHDIKGIVYRDNGEVKFTGPPAPIRDIDSIPAPSRHLLKNDLYLYGTPRGMKRCTSIMTSRGCPFHCIFCSTQVFGKRVRKREPRLVVAEMVDAVRRYQVEHFIFLDDTFTLDRKRVLAFIDLLDKEQLGITFEMGTRADLVDEDLVSKLVKVGLCRIGFGLEAVNPEIRETMRKQVPLEAYVKANRLTNKYGVETLNPCMLGLPGETKETVRETLAFLRRSRDIKQANFSIATPYPGTELFDMAKNEKYGLRLLSDDFSTYRRYGSAVMSVGDLSPDDLVRMQNDAYVSIYMAPWRWLPMLKKSGVIGGLLMMLRLMRSLPRVLVNGDGLFWFPNGRYLPGSSSGGQRGAESSCSGPARASVGTAAEWSKGCGPTQAE